eukprot:2352900-Amphidinium_carterae.4
MDDNVDGKVEDNEAAEDDSAELTASLKNSGDAIDTTPRARGAIALGSASLLRLLQSTAGLKGRVEARLEQNVLEIPGFTDSG